MKYGKGAILRESRHGGAIIRIEVDLERLEWDYEAASEAFMEIVREIKKERKQRGRGVG